MIDRFQLLDQKIEAIRGEMNMVLNDMATTLDRMIKMNKMFQIYVDENLRELREKAGLSGALITDAIETVSSPDPLIIMEHEPRTGKEL